ncbi:MAG: HAMP domain-containing protein, partial [Magnetococcales bacterium]|nr:HAMP domain-containing protein [Magnetococcales bacterium]
MAVLKRLKFRTVILLGILASFIMICIVTTGILLASRWSDQLVRMDRTLDNMTQDISELVILAHEYVTHREERPRLQWISKHQQVSNRLQEVIGLELPYADVQSEMQKYVREASTLFDRLCRLHQRTTELTPEVKLGLQERLSGQLLATLQALLTHSSRLTELNSQWMNARRQRAFDLMMAGVVILGVFITWLFQLLGRRIGQHLLMLNQGVSQIANGQLEQRLEKLAEDEIGQLTDGINTMCQQLCQITVSRASLVEEVEQRRLVEDALRRERDLVQGYLQVAAFILLVMDRHGKIDYINPEGCRVLGVGQQELLGQNWFARFMLP